MDPSHRRFQAAMLGVTLAALAASVIAADVPKPAPPSPDKGVKPLKVFILAGQSNMQGHANVSTLDSMADDPKTAPLLEEMRGPDGKPRVCEKVWISSVGCAGDGWSDIIEQKGKLTAGFGASPEEIGPEFTFGLAMEKRLGEPILIIKTAWGGRSLHTDFRPLSAGPETINDFTVGQWKRMKLDVEEETAKIQKRGGVFYGHMIEHVRKVLKDIKRVVPDYDPEQGYELAGFVWFQGFNDMIDDWTYHDRMESGGYDQYAELLAHLIRDVRKDLSAPKVPFVIGVMGIGGVPEGKKPPQLYFRQAQAAPASLPEFKGNVAAVETAPFWDDGLDALQQRMEKLEAQLEEAAKKDPTLNQAAKDAARKKAVEEHFTPEELKHLKGISNGGYHYLGAAKILAPIGKAFADAIPPAEPKPEQPTKEESLKPVKVFILAGQSNMEGQGFIKADPQRNGGKRSLEYLVKDPATADKFKHLVDKDGQWVVRDDVWIHYLDRKGRLTVGYGAKEDRIGPEIGFGDVIGDAYEEPVLLIKLAWGGKSLAKDFRPPSSGGEVGPHYKEIVEQMKAVLKDLKKEFPEFGDRGCELAGFGCHQGWNDRINQAFNDEYEKNMANFIRDIRKDLGVKNLPFVIAETGMSGPEEKHPRALSLIKAQVAVAEYGEFKGNVAFVGTRSFWRDKEASPTGQAYHWNNNTETYYLIGEAMGQAMKELCETNTPAR
jgi:Carbohydrate esterase, sialic acid-specific acetylesterase